MAKYLSLEIKEKKVFRTLNNFSLKIWKHFSTSIYYEIDIKFHITVDTDIKYQEIFEIKDQNLINQLDVALEKETMEDALEIEDRVFDFIMKNYFSNFLAKFFLSGIKRAEEFYVPILNDPSAKLVL